ncbi:MAG: N-acetylmuramoyl-L-alanine amidase family protein, partial [Oscillospiraceae bacterium]
MKKYIRSAAALAAVVLSFNAAALCTSAEFVTENGSTYYLDDSGDKVTGLEEIDGKTYYFDRKGVMQTGWQTIRRKYTCYFRKNGSMVTGRAKIGGKSYYFNEKGYMQTGNVIIGKEIFLY